MRLTLSYRVFNGIINSAVYADDRATARIVCKQWRSQLDGGPLC